MSAAALVPAVGGIFSSLIGTTTSKLFADQGNAFNERMLQKQMDYNTGMYERQLSDSLAYSDPSFIRGRLENAGYNPNVIAGSQLGSAASIPTTLGVTTPQAVIPSSDMSGLSSGLQASVALSQAEERMQSEVMLQGAQQHSIEIENQTKYARAVADIMNIMSETRDRDTRNRLDLILKGLDADFKRESITKTQEETNLVRTQVKANALENLASEKKLNFLDQQLKIDLANRSADLALKVAQKQLTEKQVQVEIQRVAETMARSSLMQAQSSRQRSENQLFNQTYQERVRMIREELHNMIYDTDKLGIFNTMSKGLRSLGMYPGY